MTKLADLAQFLDRELDSPAQADFCPNGVQVEGKATVSKVVCGVTACMELFQAAADKGADLVVVHHGLFWKGWEPRIQGVMGARIRFLLEHGISLIGYHLPLDRHPKHGNNAQLAERLGVDEWEGIAPYAGRPVGLVGDLGQPLTAADFEKRLEEVFEDVPLRFAFGPEVIQRVGVLTGKGDHDFQAAIDAGADAYVTGEAGVSTRELAREAGVHFFAPGHHATERFGVMALGRLLHQTYGLEWEYVDVENPV